MTAVATQKQFDAWSDKVQGIYCPMEIRTQLKQPFQCDVVSKDLRKTCISCIGSGQVDVYRRKFHISQIADANYLVKFQLHGEGLVKQLNRTAHLKPGDFVICNTAEPYELHFQDTYRQAVLAIPDTTMQELYSDIDSFVGLRMDSAIAPHSLLSHFVQDLIRQSDKLDLNILQRLEANILDLLATSLYAEAKEKKHIYHQHASTHQLLSIKRLINLNLSNPHLSPDYIAEQSHISKRYLHMLFKPEGISVSRYIQKQRLEACRDALSSEKFRHMSMTDIALEWGFSDASHFHRCFKAEYEITPRQYRLSSLG